MFLRTLMQVSPLFVLRVFVRFAILVAFLMFIWLIYSPSKTSEFVVGEPIISENIYQMPVPSTKEHLVPVDMVLGESYEFSNSDGKKYRITVCK